MVRILLLEPDALLARTYRHALKQVGYMVEVRPTAQAAIHASDAQKPDVVVTELQLVAHSGIEFLYEFRSYADWLSVPIIIHTHVPPAEFADARDLLMNELGVREYLYKPQTTLKQLLRSISNLIAVQ